MGLHEAIFETGNKCPIDYRTKLFFKIGLSGSALVPGMKREKEPKKNRKEKREKKVAGAVKWVCQTELRKTIFEAATNVPLIIGPRTELFSKICFSGGSTLFPVMESKRGGEG
jgi:hypothetical protein